jgi:hypothetical protein
VLATIMGTSDFHMPYMSHMNMPMQNSSEKRTMVLSLEGLKRVFHDFSSCGNSETVVNVAATNPTAVTASIVAFVCAPELFTFPSEHANLTVSVSRM